jgi:hypothetical protein
MGILGEKAQDLDGHFLYGPRFYLNMYRWGKIESDESKTIKILNIESCISSCRSRRDLCEKSRKREYLMKIRIIPMIDALDIAMALFMASEDERRRIMNQNDQSEE